MLALSSPESGKDKEIHLYPYSLAASELSTAETFIFSLRRTPRKYESALEQEAIIYTFGTFISLGEVRQTSFLTSIREMNQVYVCSSYFHVYVSILKTIFRKDATSKSLIILNDHMRDHMAELIPSIVANNFFDFHLKVSFHGTKKVLNKENLLISRIVRREKRVVELVEGRSRIADYHDFIRGSEINIFNNRGLAYVYFLLKYKDNYIRLIEDGEGNYLKLITPFQIFKRRHFLRTVIGAGHDDQIQEILVKYPERVQASLRHKAKPLHLHEMQAQLTTEQREKILLTFMQGVTINLSEGSKLLLVTQPFSEDKFFNEQKKIDLYNQILEPYGAHYEIFIKPHPRDMTDYKGRLRYPFTEIPKGFPLEMFNLIEGIHFDVGLTLYSSSMNNINVIDKKIFLGKDYLKNF